MNLREVQRNWNIFGHTDPYWSILTEPGKQDNGWNPEEFFATGRYEIAAVMTYVLGVAPAIRRRRALDFGCGVGRLTQPLADHFDRVSGIDIAPSMLQRAREFNTRCDRCEFILNDRPDLSLLPSNGFDFVYSNITLQHIPRRFALAYIREFVRVLAPRGILLFQLPSRLTESRHGMAGIALPFLRAYRNLFPGKRAVMEMFGTPAGQVRNVLERAGAEIVSIDPDGSAGSSWESFRYCARKP